MFPVKHHAVSTCVTGDLRYIQFDLQLVICLDTDITGDRVAGNITVQHTVHKGLLECRYIKIAVSDALDSLIYQFAQWFGTLTQATGCVDRTLTNRHLAIHLILEGEGAFDRCLAVQLIVKCAGSGIDVVILHHRDTYHIPVFPVITRNHILYVRNQQFGICLSRINGLRRILTIEFGSEIEGVGSAHLDIEFYITEAIYSLSRYVVRFALTFLNRALAIVAQTEFIYKVSLGEQAFVNSHTHCGVAVAGVLTCYLQYFVVQILVFLEVCGIQFVPHLRVSGLAISLVQADWKSIIAGITAERFHQFRSELEVTASYRTGDTDDNRVFLQELLKRTCRNGIREMLASSQFLALGHHVLHNRECESSLYFVGILSGTDIPQVCYRFHLVFLIIDFVNLRFRDDIPYGVLGLRISAVPLQFDKRSSAINCVKRRKRQRVRPETKSSGTLYVYIHDTVFQCLKRTVLDGGRLFSMSSQVEVPNRRSSHYRALIGELDNAFACSIVFVLQMETEVVAAFHYVAQINGIPEVGVSRLCVAGNPVERNSRRAIATFSCFGQTDLQRDLLGRMNLKEHFVALDILKQVTRELFAVRFVSSNRFSADFVLD